MKGGEIAGERVCAAGSLYPHHVLLLGEMPTNVGLGCRGESGGENKKRKVEMKLWVPTTLAASPRHQPLLVSWGERGVWP